MKSIYYNLCCSINIISNKNTSYSKSFGLLFKNQSMRNSFCKFNQIIFYCLHLKNAGCFFMNFFKTHQQNLNFSPYYRGVFFCYREIKCKQGVKNFEKHPNKMEIFLRIVEGLFSWGSFCFQICLCFFLFEKSISRIIRKEAAQ